MRLNTTHPLLIFCYFLISISILSCNSKPETKQDNTIEKKDEVISTNTAPTQNIIFFGTSLTAGLGLDIQEAYPALIQQKIDSLQLGYTVINAGLSGDTSASGKNRLSWVLNQPVAIFVLELGANDGLRGVPIEETKKNLQAIINEVKEYNENAIIVLVGMEMPPNMGASYTENFRAIFPELAKKNNLALIPFLLENVGGIAELNQADGIHPTAEGQKIMAKNVWSVLHEFLE